MSALCFRCKNLLFTEDREVLIYSQCTRLLCKLFPQLRVQAHIYSTAMILFHPTSVASEHVKKPLTFTMSEKDGHM